jgi:hypothetical protein
MAATPRQSSTSALVLAATALAAVALPSPRVGLADDGTTKTKPAERLNPELARVLKDLCIRGGCRDSDGGRALVGVWRDKDGKIGAIVYRGFACPHATITYHDAKGKLLLVEQTGPREPDEWNSPNDKKINALMAGLKEVESESCARLKKDR